MKKIKYIVLLILFLLFPINALATDQGNKNCYYEGTSDSNTYKIKLSLYNMRTEDTLEVGIESYYYKGKNYDDKNDVYKTEKTKSIVNFDSSLGSSFNLKKHVRSLRMKNDVDTLLKENNNDLCPKNIYLIKNTKKKYGLVGDKVTETLFMLCNTSDECKGVSSHIKKVYSNADTIKTTFTSSNGYGYNGTPNKKKDTNISDTYKNIQNEQKEICDKNNSKYDEKKCSDLKEQLKDLEGQSTSLPSNSVKATLEAQNEINKNLSFCTGNTLRAFQALGYMIFIAKVIIPLLLIIMGSIDLAKAVLNSNEKPNKEVLTKFAKRLAAALIVFLIPSVLDFAIGLVDGAKDAMENENTKVSSCTKCLFDPLGSECKAPENLTNE